MTTARITLATILAVLIPSIYGIDVLLHRVEISEVHSEAAGLFARGRRLLDAGRAAEAAELLHRAATLERGNIEYRSAYAEALLGAGKPADAAQVLIDLAKRIPNDGRTNLLLARAAKARHDFADEADYYHRAIYGVWSGDASARSNEARLEWIGELSVRGEHKLMLGELLPLEVFSQDFETLQKTADYLRTAGSPTRARDLYKTLLETHRTDVDLLKGLGQPEAEAGEYSAAHFSFLRASELRPGDEEIRHDMALAEQLSALDPTSRRLPSATKYERSMRILQLVRDAAGKCEAPPQALEEADQALKRKPRDTSNEQSEALLRTAENLWKTRPAGCPSPEVLPALMRKLEQ